MDLRIPWNASNRYAQIASILIQIIFVSNVIYIVPLVLVGIICLVTPVQILFFNRVQNVWINVRINIILLLVNTHA
jgi:hypothetical protein